MGAAVPIGFTCGTHGRVTTTAGAFAGCEDVHYTPAYPLTVRFLATMYLD